MTEITPEFQGINHKSEYELGRNDLLLRALPVNAFIDVLQNNSNLNPPDGGMAFFTKYSGSVMKSGYAYGTDNIGVFLVFPEESGRLPLKDQLGSVYGNETVTKPGTEIPPDMWMFIKPSELETIKDCRSKEEALKKLADRTEPERQAVQEARELIVLRKELSRLEGIFDQNEVEGYNFLIQKSNLTGETIDLRYQRTHYTKFYENLPEVKQRIELYKKMIRFLVDNRQREIGHRDRYLVDISHGLYSLKDRLSWDEPKMTVSADTLKSSFDGIKAMNFEGDVAHLESLRDLVRNNPVLQYIFAIDFGLAGKHIDHSLAVMDQGERQIANGLKRLSIVSDPSKFLRATLFTHDVGKVFALDINRSSHAQHQYSDTVMDTVLPSWGFNDREVDIAKAIWSENIIGEYFEGVLSPEDTSRKLEEVAEKLKFTSAERVEFWRLLEASYISDTSTYEAYSYLFENKNSPDNALVFSRYAEKRIGSIREAFVNNKQK